MIMVWLVLILLVSYSLNELVINVSRGQEDSNIFQQSITGNISSDIVTIEYVTTSGVGVTQLTDFRAGVTITSVTVPGEQELGQPRYQVFCFLSSSPPDIIPPEAVTKLRQKHPGTVRVAEENKGTSVVDNTVGLVVSRSGVLSNHLATMCKEAKETTFAPPSLIQAYQEGTIQGARGRKGDQERPSVESFTLNELSWDKLERCANVEPGSNESCICSLDNCVYWYPCSLKYCHNNGGEGEHRCGIRTCSKCTTLRFISKNKNLCSWDFL